MINGIGSVSKQLIEEIDKTDIQFIYYYTDGVFAKYKLNEKNTEWMQKYNEYYKINTNIEYDKVIKILTFVYEDEPEKERVIDAIAKKHKNLHGVRTGHHCYEILRKDQHKGNTVKIISDMFNQYYRCSVGVGDSMNDLPMLDYVGVGYVVDTVSKELGQYKFRKLNKNRDIDINEILEQYK
jgi:hydroxymethylpyrimidine pyrophosphatase-like HAD family hydrolase